MVLDQVETTYRLEAFAHDVGLIEVVFDYLPIVHLFALFLQTSISVSTSDIDIISWFLKLLLVKFSRFLLILNFKWMIPVSILLSSQLLKLRCRTRYHLLLVLLTLLVENNCPTILLIDIFYIVIDVLDLLVILIGTGSHCCLFAIYYI